jgi:shikimate kinase/3-dehydroquinate synthase
VAAEQLSVKGAVGEYTVLVGPGLLESALPEFVAAQNPSGVAVVSDQTVADLYGEALAERLGGTLIVLPVGEGHKRLETVRTIYDRLLEAGADRSTIVVALGGGVIGDMAGFATASFMRGVRLVQAPTTLLAMVDSSIGGKTGVDLPQGKNLIGAFKDPLAVFADSKTLDTLPADEFSCGMAEVLKAGLLDDDSLLTYQPSDPRENMIARAVHVKAKVVEADRLESGVRAHLNLGHTFGHALEQTSGYSYKHGQAVAIGLVAAVRLSARLGLCADSLIGLTEDALARWDLPIRFRGYSPEAIWEAMRHDKKWRGGAARFVLIEGVGHPTIRDDVAKGDALAVLAEIQQES